MVVVSVVMMESVVRVESEGVVGMKNCRNGNYWLGVKVVRVSVMTKGENMSVIFIIVT